LRHATLGFDYAAFGMPPTAPAYQRLLLDAIEGNATLFIRGDETETAWAFADAIRAGWAVDPPPPVYDYPAGSWGPREADDLFRGCEGTWGRGGVDVDQ
jgi:glucose-6-phosphate 1-dehydrogenase